MNIYRKAYSVVGALLLLEYLGQFYLIAMAVFTVGAAHGSTNPHTIYSAFKNADTFAGLHFFEGMVVIPITTLVLIGLSFAARHPRKSPRKNDQVTPKRFRPLVTPGMKPPRAIRIVAGTRELRRPSSRARNARGSDAMRLTTIARIEYLAGSTFFLGM